MQILRRDYSTAIRKIPVIAIDIENHSDTGIFICGSLFGKYKDSNNNIHDVDEFYTNQNMLCSRLKELSDKNGKENSFILTGYNFGYDHMFLSSIIDDSTLFYSNSRFITCRLKKSKGRGIKLIDIFNHTHEGSLEDWIGYLDMEKKYNIKKIGLDDIENRNRNDTKATYYLSVFIQDFYERLGVGMKLTVASTSLALFKRKFFKYYFKRDNDFFCEFERKAFFGGRTELFERGLRKVRSYDVNSTYLSVMAHELLPDPSTTKYYDSDNRWKENFEKHDGIFHCRVFVPKQKICPLPYHHEKKLIFPYGIFEGHWTKIELQESLKHGTKILNVFDYIIYKKSIPLYNDFAKFIWSERKYWKKQGNKGMDMMTKRIGNSGYGKLGEKINDTAFSGKLEDFHGDISGRIKITKHEGVEYISIPKDNEKTVESDHSFPVIPVHIAAYARIKLLRKMKEHEKNMIYCDTDSIKYIDDNIIEKDGKELGEWGFEYEKEQYFWREKFYGDKCRGVPKRSKIFSTISDKKSHAVFESPNKFKESIRRGLIFAKWEQHDKIIDYTHSQKRIWDGEFSNPIKLGGGEK